MATVNMLASPMHGGLTHRDASALEQYRAGGPEMDDIDFDTELAGRLYDAMRRPSGLGRDEALTSALAQEPADIRDAVERQIMAVDPTEILGDVEKRTTKVPPQLDESALYGLPGEIVRAIDPHTEADPVAILLGFLVAFGCAAGRTSHAVADGSRHGLNLFAVIVATTSKGRKGSSWSRVKQLIERVDPVWAQTRILSGLSTGEGLINAVRDPVDAPDPPGISASDKRLLVIEEEFASTLKVGMRDGNTLYTTLRHAWDNEQLNVLTRANPLHASAAHISVLGHITREELLKYLTETEYASGYANRFLWLYARRSKLLPDGGGQPDFGMIVPRLHKALEFARAQTAPICRDPEAAELWRHEYQVLSEERSGLLGALTARAEAHTLRLSVLYAVLDSSPDVRVEHLRAALALWRYADDSAAYIFGDRTGDPLADRIVTFLRGAGPGGLGLTEISAKLGRNYVAGRIRAALDLLTQRGAVVQSTRHTTGRDATVYHAT